MCSSLFSFLSASEVRDELPWITVKRDKTLLP